ncbi:MAG: hypothetical protein LBK94_09100 [Prevotellaceae bacterium]|jgi:hypothetical protein|nr:hypothetical protein [Prevotellaceae bacterium]
MLNSKEIINFVMRKIIKIGVAVVAMVLIISCYDVIEDEAGTDTATNGITV